MRRRASLWAIGAAALVGFSPVSRAQPAAAAAFPKDVYPDSGFRLPLLQRDQLDDQGKKLYDEATRQDGRNIVGLRGPTGMRLYSPKVGELQRQLNQALRFESGISGTMRELAILVTARETNSQFEWAAHQPIALREGLSQSTIDVVKFRRTTAGLPEPEAVVIQLGRQIFGAKKVTPDIFARALKLCGPRGLFNLVALMGAYSSTAALLTAFDMQLPPGEKPPLPLP
ncbi:MAG: carboxymuconolactone decarboxylase family protein [Acidobacteriia bacterium]|nr:carboxymuconolactone decarboxylase family protein [Terriglobia bacterium]